MPSRRSLLHIAAFASALLATLTSAAPFPQQHFEPASTNAVIPSDIAVENSLCEYYEDVVDQVMETVTESIFASASHSFMMVRHYQVSGYGKRTLSCPYPLCITDCGSIY